LPPATSALTHPLPSSLCSRSVLSRLLRLISFPSPSPTATYTLSLHDALPISTAASASGRNSRRTGAYSRPFYAHLSSQPINNGLDRKSTRLNSSHEWISYAVFCLKKKKYADAAHTRAHSL